MFWLLPTGFLQIRAIVYDDQNFVNTVMYIPVHVCVYMFICAFMKIHVCTKRAVIKTLSMSVCLTFEAKSRYLFDKKTYVVSDFSFSYYNCGNVKLLWSGQI